MLCVVACVWTGNSGKFQSVWFNFIHFDLDFMLFFLCPLFVSHTHSFTYSGPDTFNEWSKSSVFMTFWQLWTIESKPERWREKESACVCVCACTSLRPDKMSVAAGEECWLRPWCSLLGKLKAVSHQSLNPGEMEVCLSCVSAFVCICCCVAKQAST